MRIVLLMIIALSVSGCSLFGKKAEPIEISCVPIEKVPLILPDVDQYRGRDVEWVIVTPANYQQIIKDISRKGSPALFALTSKGYENIGLNQSDILKLIKQQREIIIAYEKYYQADFFLEEETEEEEVLEKIQPTADPDDDIPEIE